MYIGRLFGAILLVAAFHARAAAPVDSMATCRLDIRIPEVVSAARVVVLGEIHGTKETPAFAAEYACLLALSHAQVILGLEIATEEQSAIDSYLASGGSEQDRQRLIAGKFWQKSFQDGRSSQAMVGVIERLRQLKAIGLGLTVVAFAGGDAGATWDARMAGTLSRFIEHYPDAKVVALVGNAHAPKTKDTPFHPGKPPMAYFLTPFELVSLWVDYPAGTAWNCSASGCGVHTMGYGEPPNTPLVEISINPGAREGFDGYVRVASASASLPAKDGSQ